MAIKQEQAVMQFAQLFSKRGLPRLTAWMLSCGAVACRIPVHEGGPRPPAESRQRLCGSLRIFSATAGAGTKMLGKVCWGADGGREICGEEVAWTRVLPFQSLSLFLHYEAHEAVQLLRHCFAIALPLLCHCFAAALPLVILWLSRGQQDLQLRSSA